MQSADQYGVLTCVQVGAYVHEQGIYHDDSTERAKQQGIQRLGFKEDTHFQAGLAQPIIDDLVVVLWHSDLKDPRNQEFQSLAMLKELRSFRYCRASRLYKTSPVDS